MRSRADCTSPRTDVSRPPERAPRWGLVTCLVILSLAAGCRGAEVRPAFQKVILLSIDTLRADYLDVYTPGLGVTPRLADFAADAQVFDDAITAATSTLPSHTSLLYSVDTFVHRAYLSSQPTVGVPSPVDVLRERGFRTAAFVGGGQLRPQFGLDRGFETYEVVNTRNINAETRDTDRLGDLLTAASVFLRQHGDDPFFLFLHTYEPHTPYNPPAEFLEPFVDGLPGAPGLELEAPLEDFAEEVGVAESDWRNDSRRVQYAAEVRYVDDFFGRLLRRIENLGLADEVVVIVVSDHGESLGERGVIGHNRFYTEQLRVPLLMRVPGVAGARHTEPVHLTDVMPTIYSLLGQAPPYTFMGTGLEPLWRGDRSGFAGRTRFSENKGTAAVLRGPWKVVFDIDARDNTRLFNLEEDPGELVDRFEERPQLALELIAAYDAHVRRHEPLLALFPHGDEALDELDPAIVRELRALGYIQ